jgi:cytochrome c-type biogenesis protein CcmE
MDDKIHKQFMLESSIIHDSCKFATDNAIRVNEKYERMSPEDLYFYGPEILKELEYWENRCLLEERILTKHMEKYRDYIDENEEI